MAESQPLVAVIMGSKSDWEVMRQCDEVLASFGVPHECRVLSAHRTPAQTAEYVSQAESRGIEVVIAAAGGARSRMKPGRRRGHRSPGPRGRPGRIVLHRRRGRPGHRGRARDRVHRRERP